MNFNSKTPKSCPPKDASPSDKIFYRFVFSDPATPDDFLIWVEEPKNQHMLAEKQAGKACPAFAISLFSTETALVQKFARYPNALNDMAKIRKSSFIGIAAIQLDANSGVLKQTGGNKAHHDLWPDVTCKLHCKVISLRRV